MLNRNSEGSKHRYARFDVYKSNTDLYFTNNKYIVAWARNIIGETLPNEPNIYFEKLEDSFQDEILSKLTSNQTSRDTLSIIKHFAINECYAWKQSIQILSYLNNEYVGLRDFKGMKFYVYVSNHLIFLPQCQQIDRINLLRNDFVEREPNQCSKELPIVYYLDLQIYTGYINRFGIISDQSSDIECKNLRQTFIIPNYDIDLLPSEKYDFLPITINRNGNNLDISMKKKHLFDNVDPFNYGKNHFSLRYLPELHKGTHLEPNVDVEILHLTYEDELSFKDITIEPMAIEQPRTADSTAKTFAHDSCLWSNILLVIIINIICLIFYNRARNMVNTRRTEIETKNRQRRVTIMNAQFKKDL